MRRWFLSYHSPDFALAERLAAAIEHRDGESRVFLAAKALRAGGAWQEALAREITEADAFILLIGPSGIGRWQVPEYNEAHDRSVKDRLPIVLVLIEGQMAPGLPFLRQLHWLTTPDLTSEKDLGRLIDAVSGEVSPPGTGPPNTVESVARLEREARDAGPGLRALRASIRTTVQLDKSPEKV
jgi:hypothetical protein